MNLTWFFNTISFLKAFFLHSQNIKFLACRYFHTLLWKTCNFCSLPLSFSLCEEPQFKGQSSKALWPTDLLKRHIPSVLWSIRRRIYMVNQKAFPPSHWSRLIAILPWAPHNTQSSQRGELTLRHNTYWLIWALIWYFWFWKERDQIRGKTANNVGSTQNLVLNDPIRG